MGNLFCKNERTTVFEPLDNDRVSLIDLHTREGAAGALAVAFEEVTIIINRHGLWNIKANASVVVVYTVTRCGVNNTGTIVKGDVLCVDKLTGVTKVTKNWLLVLIAGKLNTSSLPGVAFCVLSQLPIGITKLSSSLLCKSLSNNLYVSIRKLKSNIVSLRVQNNCLVSRHCPWSCSPDVYPSLTCVSLKTLRNSSKLKANKDCSRGDIVILNLCLRKSCVVMSTPVNRLGASIHRTLIIDGLEDLNISCVVIVDVSEIRVIPLAQNTKALKALTLGIYLLNCHLAAKLTDLLGR